MFGPRFVKGGVIRQPPAAETGRHGAMQETQDPCGNFPAATLIVARTKAAGGFRRMMGKVACRSGRSNRFASTSSMNGVRTCAAGQHADMSLCGWGRGGRGRCRGGAAQRWCAGRSAFENVCN